MANPHSTIPVAVASEDVTGVQKPLSFLRLVVILPDPPRHWQHRIACILSGLARDKMHENANDTIDAREEEYAAHGRGSPLRRDTPALDDGEVERHRSRGGCLEAHAPTILSGRWMACEASQESGHQEDRDLECAHAAELSSRRIHCHDQLSSE